MGNVLYIVGSTSYVLRAFEPSSDYESIFLCDRKKSSKFSARSIDYDLKDPNSNTNLIGHASLHSHNISILFSSYVADGLKNSDSIVDVQQAFLYNCIKPVNLFSSLSLAFPKRKLTGVFISSIYAHISPKYSNYKDKISQNPLYYGICKAGVEQGLKWLSTQNQLHRFNSVVLGPMPNSTAAKSDPGLIDCLIKSLPSEQMVNPMELSRVLNFLLDTEMVSLRGFSIPLDGGYMLW